MDTAHFVGGGKRGRCSCNTLQACACQSVSLDRSTLCVWLPKLERHRSPSCPCAMHLHRYPATARWAYQHIIFKRHTAASITAYRVCVSRSACWHSECVLRASCQLRQAVAKAARVCHSALNWSADKLPHLAMARGGRGDQGAAVSWEKATTLTKRERAAQICVASFMICFIVFGCFSPRYYVKFVQIVFFSLLFFADLSRCPKKVENKKKQK